MSTRRLTYQVIFICIGNEKIYFMNLDYIILLFLSETAKILS